MERRNAPDGLNPIAGILSALSGLVCNGQAAITVLKRSTLFVIPMLPSLRPDGAHALFSFLLPYSPIRYSFTSYFLLLTSLFAIPLFILPPAFFSRHPGIKPVHAFSGRKE